VEDPPPLRYPRGRPARVSVRLRNDGHTVWPAFSDYGFLHCRINYRWSLNGTLLPETHMLGLERNLGPGESIVIHGWLAVPALPGKYELELMLLQMLQADRGAVGGAVARFPVEVD